MQIIKTLLADDHYIFIEGLKTVLNEALQYQIKVIDVARSGEELIQKVKSARADLVITGLNLSGKDGLDVIEVVRQSKNPIKVLVLSAYDDPKIVKTAFKLGADGYILKCQPLVELYQAIHEILMGNTYVGKGIHLNGTNGSGHGSHGIHQAVFDFEDRFIKKYNLTKRELEILGLISQALNNKEIAKELYISDQTVGVHRKNIMRKLGVSNTAGLIKLAYDYSLV
ncbi:MAG: response regulator transcription factor [Saprospiraceae bacterium]